MSVRASVLMIFLVVVAGCSRPNPAREYEALTAAELDAVDFHEIKLAYAAARHDFGEQPNLRAAIERRGLFTAAEWEAIDARQAFVGMSLHALLASWGEPDAATESPPSGRSACFYGDRVVRLYSYGPGATFVEAIEWR